MGCSLDYGAFRVDGSGSTGAESSGGQGADGRGANGQGANGQGGSSQTGGGVATGAAGTGGDGGGPSGGSGSGAAGGSSPTIVVAGELLVDLDATQTTAGTGSWQNLGSLGPFARIGAPLRDTYQGVTAVWFDGAADAYEGPDSVPTIEGSSDRSIEVWVCNPVVESGEETMLSWSDRGGPEGTNLTFNYGSNGSFGAVGHWGSPDIGWTSLPTPDVWHHLVYTYDGTTARVYVDGAEDNSEQAALDTKTGFSVNLAAQRNGASLQFDSEFGGGQQAGSLWIATARVHSQALSPTDVAFNFSAELPRFR